MNDIRSSTETINLYPYGDRELWYAHNEENGWALPVFVVWHEDKVNARHFALIEPCFGLYTSQHLVLTKLFEDHDFLGRNARWLILKSMCEALLHKAPGVTPERYYKWPDCKLRPLPAWKPIYYSPENPNGVGRRVRSDDQRAFVNYVSEVSNVPSSIIRIVLDAVSDAGPRWMLEKSKAVDLGFCRIITAPFRANWKEIITFKLGGKNLLKIFSGNANGELTKALDDAGLPEVLTSPHNIGLKDRRVDYVMEVIPTNSFEKFAKEFSAKLITLGKASHVQHYERMVESLYGELVDSLRYYIKKISTPFARVSYRFGAGIISLLPAQRSVFKSRRLPLANLPQRIIPTTSRFNVFSEQDRLDLVRKKVAALPEVSGLPQETPDVWERDLASNVECFPERDDAPGTIGVPLLGSRQGNNSGQSMLPGPEAGAGNTSGMDK